MAVIRVIYKSGATVDVKCKEFTVTKRGGSLEKVEWDEADPKPLFFGIDEVAAVYRIKP